jgi:hypothetical protein
VDLAVREDVAALHLHGRGDVGAGDPDDGVDPHVPQRQEHMQRRGRGELGPDQPLRYLAGTVSVHEAGGGR